MSRCLSLLFTLALLTGCSFNHWWKGHVIRPVDATEVSRIIIVYSEKLNYDKHLILDDSVIFYDHYINRLRLDYNTMDSLQLCDARALLVDVVEGLLGRLNVNEQVVSQLAHGQLSPDDLEIYIKFPSFYTNYVDLQMVGLITLRGGVATYFAANALNCSTDCWGLRSEYYYQSKNFAASKREGEALYKPGRKETEPSLFKEERYTQNQTQNPGGYNSQAR